VVVEGPVRGQAHVQEREAEEREALTLGRSAPLRASG
jgi:hypothetical protein